MLFVAVHESAYGTSRQFGLGAPMSAYKPFLI